jgi:hypothetical protein
VVFGVKASPVLVESVESVVPPAAGEIPATREIPATVVPVEPTEVMAEKALLENRVLRVSLVRLVKQEYPVYLVFVDHKGCKV